MLPLEQPGQPPGHQHRDDMNLFQPLSLWSFVTVAMEKLQYL